MFTNSIEEAKRNIKTVMDFSYETCIRLINEEPDNWNFDIVGLFDVEIPNMIMVHAAHDWASHMHLTIFDLMHVRKFKSEITIEIHQKYDNE